LILELRARQYNARDPAVGWNIPPSRVIAVAGRLD
jgi:hypothetical protein